MYYTLKTKDTSNYHHTTGYMNKSKVQIISLQKKKINKGANFKYLRNNLPKISELDNPLFFKKDNIFRFQISMNYM